MKIKYLSKTSEKSNFYLKTACVLETSGKKEKYVQEKFVQPLWKIYVYLAEITLPCKISLKPPPPPPPTPPYKSTIRSVVAVLCP